MAYLVVTRDGTVLSRLPTPRLIDVSMNGDRPTNPGRNCRVRLCTYRESKGEVVVAYLADGTEPAGCAPEIHTARVRWED